jgi:hypothetical protein
MMRVLPQDDSMDIGEQSLAVEFAVVDEVVRANAPEFAARGFTLMNVTEGGTPPFVRSTAFHFSHARAGLLLDLSFFAGGNRRGFNALISKPDNGRLDVRDYLKLHGRTETSALLTSDDPTTLREFAESAMRVLIGVFDDELKPVVEGTKFESTPFDWQGYK